MGEKASVAKVLIPVGLGVIALAVLARPAKAAPPPPPPPGYANLYGHVTDSITRQAIPGVQIALDGVTTFTDANGDYAFTNIEPGSYNVTFSKSGYSSIVF